MALIPYYHRFYQTEPFGSCSLLSFTIVLSIVLSTIVGKTNQMIRFGKPCGNMGLVPSLGSQKMSSSCDQHVHEPTMSFVIRADPKAHAWVGVWGCGGSVAVWRCGGVFLVAG